MLAAEGRRLGAGGRLFIREGHPMLWGLNESVEPATPHYPYFEHEKPLTFDEPATYVETEGPLKNSVSHSWNHGLGEIITKTPERVAASYTLEAVKE